MYIYVYDTCNGCTVLYAYYMSLLCLTVTFILDQIQKNWCVHKKHTVYNVHVHIRTLQVYLHVFNMFIHFKHNVHIYLLFVANACMYTS